MGALKALDGTTQTHAYKGKHRQDDLGSNSRVPIHNLNFKLLYMIGVARPRNPFSGITPWKYRKAFAVIPRWVASTTCLNGRLYMACTVQ